jgi:hypothetical protein
LRWLMVTEALKLRPVAADGVFTADSIDGLLRVVVQIT